MKPDYDAKYAWLAFAQSGCPRPHSKSMPRNAPPHPSPLPRPDRRDSFFPAVQPPKAIPYWAAVCSDPHRHQGHAIHRPNRPSTRAVPIHRAAQRRSLLQVATMPPMPPMPPAIPILYHRLETWIGSRRTAAKVTWTQSCHDRKKRSSFLGSF